MSTCEDDLREIQELRGRRQRAMAVAERDATGAATRQLEDFAELTGSEAPGSMLRTRLLELSDVTAHRSGPGAPPATLADVVDEWQRLRPMAQREVEAFVRNHRAWSGRIFRRATSMPKVDNGLWSALDRLDQLQRVVPTLREAMVSGQVRRAAAVADAAVGAEVERRRTVQVQLAGEVGAAVAEVQHALRLAGLPWADTRWQKPDVADNVQRLIRLGELRPAVPDDLRIGRLPALLPFPFLAGIAVAAGVKDRDRAIGLVRSLLLRLLAAVPPGGVRLTAFDPVAVGQSVAELRHLGEYDARLMDEKTWTSERDIERLTDELSEHLEVVISKYLRGQFATIDEYNQHADEVAEPYRVLAVFDYPSGFSDRATRQLLSLIENGPRCGVYVLLHHDSGAGGSRDVSVDRLVHGMQKVDWHDGTARLRLVDPARDAQWELLPDEAPPVSFDRDGNATSGCARLVAAVGTAVRQKLINPPAVTLSSLLPVLNRSRAGVLPAFHQGVPAISTDPGTWWTASSADLAVAPLGRSGAQGVTSIYFSSTDVAGGAIMVGLPRSGKTTSLHSMILTLSMLYSPDEIELYLIDAKHGVEFKAYEFLPHARMVSIHSDREFSLAILKSVDREIQERAARMKADGSGRANLTEYRRFSGAMMSRIVVVIDEFHELFEEPDRIGQEAFAAFSNIVRMGPFSGVHIVLASQTLSGMPAMDRPTMLLLPQRVAFMCNDYDAEIVMGDSNKATRFLSRTGEGLFNPARGAAAQNQPFQGLYVPTDERADIVQALVHKAADNGWTRRPRTFDGDAVVARPTTTTTAASGSGRAFAIPLGEPFTLDNEESVVLRRTRGANVLLLGDTDDDLDDLAIRAALHSALLAARDQGVDITVVDFIGDEQVPWGLTVMHAARGLQAEYVRSRAASSVLQQGAAEIADRLQRGEYQAAGRLLVLFGIQRALTLNPVDPYAFDDGEEPTLSALIVTVLKEGPEVGVHTLISTDRLRSVELRLGTDVLQELRLRVLGSAADQPDLAAATGSFGDVPALRSGQLMFADLSKGRSKRVRGYDVLTEQSLCIRTGS